MAEAGLTMSFDPDYALIIAAYETADDIGKILRCHLAIEQQIESFIVGVSRGKVDRRTTFWSKVNLLRAIRVPEKICVACDELNDVRNKFAHNSNATIANTKTSSEKFLCAVEAIFPILPQAHGTFRRRKEKIEYAINYQDADQGQRIVIAASFLSAAFGALPKLFDFGEPRPLVIMPGLNLP